MVFGVSAIEYGLHINGPEMAYTLVLFLVLLFLSRKSIRRALGALDARKKYVQDEIEQSERVRLEAEKQLAVATESVQIARTDADGIITEAKRKATEKAEEIILLSKEESLRLKEIAMDDIRAEKEKSKRELEKETILLAEEMARKVLETHSVKEG